MTDQAACHRILVIEDDEGIRETIKDLLEMEGFAARTAENGREGLRVLAEMAEPCLILLDLMMPVMNGWEFLDVLKNEQRHVLATIPVVVTTGAADAGGVEQKYGCDVLKKPVDIERLVELAQKYCLAC